MAMYKWIYLILDINEIAKHKYPQLGTDCIATVGAANMNHLAFIRFHLSHSSICARI